MLESSGIIAKVGLETGTGRQVLKPSVKRSQWMTVTSRLSLLGKDVIRNPTGDDFYVKVRGYSEVSLENANSYGPGPLYRDWGWGWGLSREGIRDSTALRAEPGLF